MKKWIAWTLAVLLLTSILAGCGPKATTEDSDLNYIQDKGTLIVGITDFEPMDYQVDGEWTGFDAELALLVGEELGVEVQFQLINWKMKETELASKTIDCIWNGLTWDEQRAEEMSLTDHYMRNRQCVVVRNEDAAALSAEGALDTVSIAAESGSAGETCIMDNFADATYIEKDGQIDVLTELLGMTVDAGVIDYVMANYLINKEGSDFSSLTILEDAIDVQDEYYSIAFRKGSDVTAKVNEILAQLMQDGTVDALAAKYGLTDAIVK